MKKLILLALALTLCLVPFSYGLGFVHCTATAKNTNISLNSSSVEDFYLLSPTALAVGEEQLFVYDNATGKLKVIENGKIVYSLSMAQPQKLEYKNGHLFVLLKNGIKVYALTKTLKSPIETAAGSDTEEPQEPSVSQEYIYSLSELGLYTLVDNTPSNTPFDFTTFSSLVDFSVVEEETNKLSVFVQLESNNNLEIIKLEFTYYLDLGCYGCKNNQTMYNSANVQGFSVASRVQKISAIKVDAGYNILCADSTNLYLVMVNDSPSCSLCSAASVLDIVATENGFSYNTAQEVIITDTTGETIAQVSENVDRLAGYKSYVYGTKTADAKVVKLYPTEEEVYKNNFTMPEESQLNKAENLSYITTTSDILLKEYPYSVTGISLAKNTDLVVLKNSQESFLNMAYVTVVINGKNERGFVNLADTLPRSVAYASIQVRTIVSTRLLSMPSTVEDENNVCLEEIETGGILQVVHNCAAIVNGNSSFLFVTTSNGNSGFVRSANVANLLQTKKQKSDANATVVRDTILYANEDGTSPVLQLSKDTRVKLSKRLNPKSKYTRVSLQNNNGTEYSGYVLTADLVSDSLTTLQIVGIVLLVINGVILLLIVAFWLSSNKRYKK